MKSLSLLRVRTRIAVPLVLLTFSILTLILRTWRLESIPPWLWWDEATQGVDARELLHGHFQVFFPSALGKEPLYVYLTTPFVAAWDGHPAAVRLAGALLGALMIPVIYLAGRALWRDHREVGLWAAIAAAGLWMTNYWPQSINRIGFQVNAFPIMLTLAVVAWLNWTHRPLRGRALVFGLTAGLTLLTYLAARITPLIWLSLYLTLSKQQRQGIRTTVPWALLAFMVVVAPLAIFFTLHPQFIFERIDTFDVVQPGSLGVVEPFRWTWHGLWGSFLGWAGDPIDRHNLPGRPPFSPGLAAMFAAGLAMGLVQAVWRKGQSAWTLMIWFVMMCVPSFLARSSTPAFPRLFGALPAALLLAAWPLGWAASAISHRRRAAAWGAGALLAILLAGEGSSTVQDYFVKWAQQTDLHAAYQGDLWAFGDAVRRAPGSLGVVPLYPGYGYQLDYAFEHVPIFQWPAGNQQAEPWLDARLGRAAGSLVMTPMWREGANLLADPAGVLPFYLAREGMPEPGQDYRDFTLLSYQMDPHPQFMADGQRTPLDQGYGSDLSLVGIRWGGAAPNEDRSSATAAAGTRIWAICTWRLTAPLPHERVALDLVDEAGHRLASDESPLMDASQAAATTWAPGTTLQTYHLITVPPTQPAGHLSLEVRVYDQPTLEPLLPADGTARLSAAVAVAAISPSSVPLSLTALHLDRNLQLDFAHGTKLLGLNGWPVQAGPGQVISLRLFWQIGNTGAVSSEFTAWLDVAGQHAASTLGRVPADMAPGSIVHTYLDIRLPAQTPAGRYMLRMATEDGGPPADLGEIEVFGRPRQFAAPALRERAEALFGGTIALLGVDAPPEIPVSAGGMISVTVVWQALSTSKIDLVRFVHALGADGRPVAQRDGPPCEGACPTTSWLPGEVLTDTLVLQVPAGVAPGVYPLATGWYTPATGSRLAALDKAGQALPGDTVTLPVRLLIKP